MKRLAFLTVLAAAACLAASQQSQPPAVVPPPAQQPPAAPQTPAPREPGVYAHIKTSMGEIVARLFEKETPITVKNFIDLATGAKAWLDPRNGLPNKSPLFDGLTFHRVIPNFMIQGGDPLANGTGGTKPIPDEIKPELKFDVAGRLGMANSGPGTGSCQFFITEIATPHLDGLHTVFGQVVEGQYLVGRIARVKTDSDKPVEPITIEKITIERVQ